MEINNLSKSLKIVHSIQLLIISGYVLMSVDYIFCKSNAVRQLEQYTINRYLLEQLLAIANLNLHPNILAKTNCL